MGTKMTSTKAIAGSVAGTLAVFLGGMKVALDTPGITDQEWVSIALTTVLGGAAAFGLTWASPANRPKP